MSGGGGDYTAGFRYLFSLHMGICRGPVDEVVEIRVGDRTAWTGSVTANGTQQVDAYELFGGEDGEGGVQGSLEFLFGEDNQLAPDLLATMVAGVTSGKPLGAVSFNGGIRQYPAVSGTRTLDVQFRIDGTTWVTDNTAQHIDADLKWFTNAPATPTMTEQYEVKIDLLESFGPVTFGGTLGQWLPMTVNQAFSVSSDQIQEVQPYYGKFNVSFRKGSVVNEPVVVWLILDAGASWGGGGDTGGDSPGDSPGDDAGVGGDW